jgi:hypothetical protein
MTVSKFVIATAIACSIASTASAQDDTVGYVTIGAGMFANDFTSGPLRQLAGGGVRLIGDHLAIGGDGTLVVGGGDILLAGALNASGHLRGQRRGVQFDPFIRGGYTRLFFLSEPGGANAANIGGGFNYWFSETRALVAQVRAVAPLEQVGSRYWLASVGIGFR